MTRPIVLCSARSHILGLDHFQKSASIYATVGNSHSRSCHWIELSCIYRLYGSPWYFQRIIQEDVVLSGYNVPKHVSTFILTKTKECLSH